MLRRLFLSLLVFGAAVLGGLVIFAADEFTNATSAAASPAPTNSAPTNATAGAAAAGETEALVRSVVILQEQLRSTQREMQMTREEADLISRRTTDLVTERLNFIEQRQADSWRSSSRLMLMSLTIMAAIAGLAVILNGWLQMRAVSRLAEVSRQIQALPALAEAASMRQLGAGESAIGAAQGIAEQLSTDIGRLQQRIEELERSSSSNGNGHANGNGNGSHQRNDAAPTVPGRASMAIAKGQTLLNLDKPDEALSCFEDAIQADPRSLEALIKKGTALERLGRVDDAIAAYDQAIEVDESTATAYLFKAGVYNRQKRYAEALQCYDKALKVQKSRGTTVQG